MKKTQYTIIFFLFFFCNCLYAENLLQENDLKYLGAFRVPHTKLGGDSGTGTFTYGGIGLSYNPVSQNLLTADRYKNILEISVPDPVISNRISDLNQAVVQKIPSDITSGAWDNLTDDQTPVGNGGSVGGFLHYNGKLYGSAYGYYDGASQCTRSHFRANPDWNIDGKGFVGFCKVGISPVSPTSANGGFVGGYMAIVPDVWADKLGGPVLTGKGAISVITRSSMGPCAWSFDPTDINPTSTAGATFLVGYPSSHPTLGLYNSDTPNLYYNRGTSIVGLVFPENYDSVLFIGRHGLGITGMGDSCYGGATGDWSLVGTEHPNSPGVYCYDKSDTGKGGHSYPYIPRIWAYDANQLASVKVGDKKPWEIYPYAIWNIPLQFTGIGSEITGACYDSDNNKIFIIERRADFVGYERYPIIHVFTIQERYDPTISIDTESQIVTTITPTFLISGTATMSTETSKDIVSVLSPGLDVNGVENWTTEVILKDGHNPFFFKVVDEAGKFDVAGIDIIYDIRLTEDDVDVSITTPNQVVPYANTHIPITGTTINAESVSCDKSSENNGTVENFSILVPLDFGENTIEISASVGAITKISSIKVERRSIPQSSEDICIQDFHAKVTSY